LINFHSSKGRLSAVGQIYGESGTPIGQIASDLCDYQPETKQLIWVYRITAQNDDGSQIIAQCIFSGIVFLDDARSSALIKGNWFHLQGTARGDGVIPSGTAMLNLRPHDLPSDERQ